MFVYLFISIINIQLFETGFLNLTFGLKKIPPFTFIHLNIIFVIIIINSAFTYFFFLKIPIIRVQLFKVRLSNLIFKIPLFTFICSNITFAKIRFFNLIFNLTNLTIHYSSVQISFWLISNIIPYLPIHFS